MAEYTEQELKKSIEQGNFSNVYFFYGEEKMLMESAVKKLVHQATGNQFLDFNYQNFDGAFADAQEIVRAAEHSNFSSSELVFRLKLTVIPVLFTAVIKLPHLPGRFTLKSKLDK